MSQINQSTIRTGLSRFRPGAHWRGVGKTGDDFQFKSRRNTSYKCKHLISVQMLATSNETFLPTQCLDRNGNPFEMRSFSATFFSRQDFLASSEFYPFFFD